MELRSVPIRLRRAAWKARDGAAPRVSAGPDRTVACNAPFSSMYLDQHGFVRACCMNDFQLLGNISEQSLSEIWHGAKAQELRRAMERHDLTVGCEFCKWRVDEGRPDLAFSKWFNDYPATEPEPDWPQQLELSISNNCNLQCVMCNGDWSSSIRTHREHRAPLPKVYGDAFFDDLADFIPHLQRVKFLGGEPFLAAETLRVMDMLVDSGAPVRCHVTTNGTQWSPRVEHILDMLPVDVAVSVDASTPEVYEAVRVGSTWDELQRNLDRFQERAAVNHTDVTVTFCLMTVNWRDFAGFCEMADARGIGCAVNTVTMPAHLSLYKLPVDELEVVLSELETIDRERGRTFGRSRATWLGELDRLRQHVDQRRRTAPVTGLDVRRQNPDFPRPYASAGDGDAPSTTSGSGSTGGAPTTTADAGSDPISHGRPADAPDGSYLVLDARNTVLEVRDGDEFLGVPAPDLVGRPIDSLIEVMSARHGEMLGLDTLETDAQRQVFRVHFAGRGGAVAMMMAPVGDPPVGRVYGAWDVDGSAG